MSINDHFVSFIWFCWRSRLRPLPRLRGRDREGEYGKTCASSPPLQLSPASGGESAPSAWRLSSTLPVHRFAAAIISESRVILIGRVFTVSPSGASASLTALAIAAGAPR